MHLLDLIRMQKRFGWMKSCHDESKFWESLEGEYLSEIFDTNETQQEDSCF